MASPVVDRADATRATTPEWVVFACGGHRFGLPLGRVGEILTPRRATRIPGCGPEVVGLIGLRGRVVTVLDLGAALGLEAAAGSPDHRLLLVDHGEGAVGLAVGEVVGVAVGEARRLAIPAEALRSLDVAPEHVLGIGEYRDRPFVALDPDRVLERLLS